MGEESSEGVEEEQPVSTFGGKLLALRL